MSEENNVTQTTEETQVKNPSTQAEDKNVPYDRFKEVNTEKNDALNQIGVMQAQIDKMNSTQKDKEQAKLVADGKLQEALVIMTDERDTYKIKADAHDTYLSTKKEQLLSQITNDEDLSIAKGLGDDIINLEKLVNKVNNVSAPSTSTARATSGKAGEFGGYSSWVEWATKDPAGYEKANGTVGMHNINVGSTD